LRHINFHHQTTFKILSKLDVNKAEGADCIPTVVLKKCAYELAVPLTKLFAHSFRKGKVPTSWKFAVVQPVPKPGDARSPSNYRPISLLPVMGKVMERVINQSIVSFLRHHDLLNDHQYGFLSERSTADLLTVLFQTWSDALDSGSEIRAVSLDISKAFDKVWHEGLLTKLKAYGIDGPLLNWLTDYLSNRSQAVCVDGFLSGSQPINAGVPQGSVLGPTLFLIFINDLLSLTSNPAHSFADDTTLHCQLPAGPLSVARQEAAADLNSDLSKISDWGEQWIVGFNSGKTVPLAISRRSDQSFPSVHFQNKELSFASDMKLLGISFNGKLSLDKHILNKLQVASRMIGVLYRLRRLFPLSSMLQLYKSLIRPHLEYCSHLLDSATKGSLLLIEKLQNRAMRILGCSDLVKENILPMSHRRNVGSLSLLYRYFHGHCSKELLGLVPTLQHLGPSTRRAGASHPYCLAVPHSRTEHHRKSFFPRTVRLWNSLPSFVFPVDYNLSQFKRNVNCALKSQLS
jgi:Reverse transcriptase (RNA-dependent DNA polymerase)